MEISNDDSWFMGIQNEKIWTKFNRGQMFELVMRFENPGPSISLKSIVYKIVLIALLLHYS